MDKLNYETMVDLVEAYEAYEEMKDKLVSLLGTVVLGERNVFDKLDKLEEVIYNLSDPELCISKSDNYPCIAYYLLNDKNMDAPNKARALLGIER